MVSGSIPCSIAAASTYGLNEDPGWRWASAAKLNWELAEYGVEEAIARMWPFVGVDRGERRLRAAARVADRAGVHRALGVGLERRVDRRIDLEPAVPDRVDPVLVDQLLLDVVEEVGLLDLLVLVAAVEAEPLCSACS